MIKVVDNVINAMHEYSDNIHKNGGVDRYFEFLEDNKVTDYNNISNNSRKIMLDRIMRHIALKLAKEFGKLNDEFMHDTLNFLENNTRFNGNVSKLVAKMLTKNLKEEILNMENAYEEFLVCGDFDYLNNPCTCF